MRGRRGAVGRRLALGILATAIALCLAPQGVRAQAPQFTVNHPPRLQLGDAPLAGFPGSAQDRVQILWQTLPVDSSSLEDFETVYRAAGSGAWSDAGVPDTVHTGFGGRVNHYVDITDLDYDTEYEALRHRIKEGRPAKGAFRITRDDTHGELTVHFRVGGSATEGADYDPIGSSLMLAEGMASAELKFATIDDRDLEGAETVRLTIEPHEDYATRAPFSDTVTLLDDEISPTPRPTSAHPPPTPATTPTPSTATMRLVAEHGL